MKPLMSERDRTAKPMQHDGQLFGGYVSNESFSRIEYYPPNHPDQCTCIYFVPSTGGKCISVLAYLPALKFLQEIPVRNDPDEWNYCKNALPISYMLLRNKDARCPILTAWHDVEDKQNRELTTVLTVQLDEPYHVLDETDINDSSNPESDRRMNLFFDAIDDLQAEYVRFLNEAEARENSPSGLSPRAKRILKGVSRIALGMLLGDFISDLDFDFLGGDDGGMLADGFDGVNDIGSDNAGGDISFTGSSIYDDDGYNAKMAEWAAKNNPNSLSKYTKRLKN